jgi:hypothetical protein
VDSACTQSQRLLSSLGREHLGLAFPTLGVADGFPRRVPAAAWKRTSRVHDWPCTPISPHLCTRGTRWRSQDRGASARSLGLPASHLRWGQPDLCTGRPGDSSRSPALALGLGSTFTSQISCSCWMPALLARRTLRVFGVTCKKFGVRLSR